MKGRRLDYAEYAKDCYSPDFKDILSPRTKELTKYRCVLCGERARITHHVFYTQGGLQDRPGFNLFPLCKVHHAVAHSKANWLRVSRDAVKGRMNTQQFISRCRRGWELYTQGGKPTAKSKSVGRVQRDVIAVTPLTTTTPTFTQTKTPRFSDRGFSWDRHFSKIDPKLNIVSPTKLL